LSDRTERFNLEELKRKAVLMCGEDEANNVARAIAVDENGKVKVTT